MLFCLHHILGKFNAAQVYPNLTTYRSIYRTLGCLISHISRAVGIRKRSKWRPLLHTNSTATWTGRARWRKWTDSFVSPALWSYPLPTWIQNRANTPHRAVGNRTIQSCCAAFRPVMGSYWSTVAESLHNNIVRCWQDSIPGNAIFILSERFLCTPAHQINSWFWISYGYLRISGAWRQWPQRVDICLSRYCIIWFHQRPLSRNSRRKVFYWFRSRIEIRDL